MPDYRHATILAVIALATVVFFFERSRGLELAADYGATPQHLRTAAAQLLSGNLNSTVVGVLLTAVTAIFLHGDISHLLYNMVFLWIFGSLAVRHLGQWTALFVLLLTGICGNIMQTCLKPDSLAPIIGASGAVCGLEGVYLGLALRWTLPWPDVWPIAHPIPPLQLGALAILGAAFDLYSLMNRHQGIAFGAHLGGFFAGLAVAAMITHVFTTEHKYERSGWKR